MQSPLLEVQNLTKIYGGGVFRREQTVALEDFSLAMPGDNPRITTIAGESGSGKTTLANLVLGFLRPSSGQILYREKDLWNMSKEEQFTFRREVQGVFQDPYGTYNPFYRVDHVMETTIKKFKLARGGDDARQMEEEALQAVGLRPNEVLGKYPHQLSGGERQRIMVARSLLTRPRLIVADEPVSMIDASLQVRVLSIFKRVREELGISFLYITHDLATAYQISDDIFILYLGSVMERGNIEAVLQNPQHPYTRLLVSSIPVPDPDVRWEGRLQLPPEEEMGMGTAGGCKYYKRCPQAMELCLEAAPPMYEVGENYFVRCHLYGKG